MDSRKALFRHAGAVEAGWAGQGGWAGVGVGVEVPGGRPALEVWGREAEPKSQPGPLLIILVSAAAGNRSQALSPRLRGRAPGERGNVWSLFLTSSFLAPRPAVRGLLDGCLGVSERAGADAAVGAGRASGDWRRWAGRQ